MASPHSPPAAAAATAATATTTSSSSYVCTWEESQAKEIVERLNKKHGDKEGGHPTPSAGDNNSHRRPFMVAIASLPGSGKTVSSFLLASILEQQGYPTMVCPHDGYHYPLDDLMTFPAVEDRVYRRGAPDTFDTSALLRDLHRLRHGNETIVKLPGFDHAQGDPEPDKHIFDRNRHDIVLCEGLYLLHDGDGWKDVQSMFDYTIYMDADIDTCIERVKIRNRCIPGYSPEEMDIRCEQVDRVNALTVLQSKNRADVIVESLAMTTRGTGK